METEMKAHTRQGAANAERNDPEKKAGEPAPAANKAKRKARI